jgi:hypothetical protein
MAEFVNPGVCPFTLITLPRGLLTVFSCAGYLMNLGQQKLTYDLQTLLGRDQALQRAAQQYYLQRGAGGGGRRDDGLMSDCSDFSD